MAQPFLHVDFQQPKEMRFNRARVRRAFVHIGQRHMRDARRLVMRRGRSEGGENPGYQTGRLAKSIGYMVPKASGRRPGFMTRIAPNQRNGQGNRLITGDFYPAFLFYGVRGGARRQRSHHRGASGVLLRVITSWLRHCKKTVRGRGTTLPVSCVSHLSRRNAANETLTHHCNTTGKLPHF
ncbi:hypothetical protein AZ012_004359 [Citrobacter amalonaticus]|nr:hypothetical protein AZ012_004359 [Citrobacter amalonaticus]